MANNQSLGNIINQALHRDILDFIPKKFSLALGGWAARGISHIGVIRYFEEHDLHPIAVSGTSMGAIIAGLLALGKTSQDMEEILQDMKWLSLVDFDLKKWFIKWDKIEEMLEWLYEGKKIEDTLIPLFIASTDVNTGEKVIFTSGKISEAVRASIWVPGVFSPKKYKNHELVDGGLTNNLPVELLPPWKVVAVSAMRDLSRQIHYKRKVFNIDWQKTIFSNGYNIMQKTIDIMLSQNESRSIISRKDVTYIRPEFDALDYYEFNKFKEFIKSGYEAAKKQLG